MLELSEVGAVHGGPQEVAGGPALVVVRHLEPETARDRLPVALAPVGALVIGDEPELREVAQVPAGHRRRGADVRRQLRRGRRSVALEMAEDRQPDRVAERPHGLRVGDLEVAHRILERHVSRVISHISMWQGDGWSCRRRNGCCLSLHIARFAPVDPGASETLDKGNHERPAASAAAGPAAAAVRAGALPPPQQPQQPYGQQGWQQGYGQQPQYGEQQPYQPYPEDSARREFEAYQASMTMERPPSINTRRAR